MNTPELTNGIIYVRVSSYDQIAGTSLDTQESICREYAQKENINILNVYIEKGESAKTIDRTEFLKAISFCSDKKNKVSAFIVFRIDRFSRNQTDYAVVREKLLKYGTRIKSVSEKIEDTPSGKFVETMFSAVAELDNSVRSEKSLSGMKKRMQEGVWVWQAPIGYYRPMKGSHLAPDPKFAPFIRIIFEEYAKGIYTYESLAKYMNSLGFTTRQGTLAIPQLMEKIIKNPLYCGIIRAWDIESKGTFEAIIDENLFYRCQPQCKNNRNTPHKKVNNDFPLRKLAVCKFCKDPLTGSSSKGRNKKYPYYHHHFQTCTHSKSISKEDFEQYFVELLDKISPNEGFEKVVKAMIIEEWNNNFKNIDVQNQVIKNEIKALEVKKQRVFELHQSQVYTDSEFLVQKDILIKQIIQKESLISNVKATDINMEEALETCFSYIRDTSKTWIDLKDDPEKRLWFQKIIFEGNIEYFNKEFGTTKISPIYNLYQSYLIDSSCLVTLPGIEPGLPA